MIFQDLKCLQLKTAFMNKNKVDSYQINTLFSRGRVLILCNYGNQITQDGSLPHRELLAGELSDSASDMEILNPVMVIGFNTL